MARIEPPLISGKLHATLYANKPIEEEIMTWNETLTGFETHLEAGGKSNNTITAFLRDLRKFESAHLTITPEETTATHLDVFLAEQRIKQDGAPRSPNSLNRLRTSLRTFFCWMKESGRIDFNPASGIKTTSVTQKPPVYLTEQEERDLLRCLRDNRTRKYALRDAAIIHLLLDTGIRVGELVGLNLDDIDGKHLRVRRAKGGSPMVKFLPARTRKVIDSYIRQERKQFLKTKDNNALFLNQQGTRLNSRAVQLLVPVWVKRTGITKSVTPHTLRHTFATSLLNKTGNLLLVQKALGHRNVTTTQIYAHVAD
ncbi:tyrosine-type recombinase/integrase [bacterium]|nr:tyrosine-type recombinase/integrase [bacterium]